MQDNLFHVDWSVCIECCCWVRSLGCNQYDVLAARTDWMQSPIICSLIDGLQSGIYTYHHFTLTSHSTSMYIFNNATGLFYNEYNQWTFMNTKQYNDRAAYLEKRMPSIWQVVTGLYFYSWSCFLCKFVVIN